MLRFARVKPPSARLRIAETEPAASQAVGLFLNDALLQI
jgi:hypothetical protein